MENFKSRAVSLMLSLVIVLTWAQPSLASLERGVLRSARPYIYSEYLDKFDTKLDKDYLWENAAPGAEQRKPDWSNSSKLLGYNVSDEIFKTKQSVMVHTVKKGELGKYEIFGYIPNENGEDPIVMVNSMNYYKTFVRMTGEKENQWGLDKYDKERMILTDISFLSKKTNEGEILEEGYWDQGQIAQELENVKDTGKTLPAWLNRPTEKLIMLVETKGKVTLKDGEKYIAQNGTEIDASLGTDNQPKNNKGEFLRRVGSYTDKSGASIQNPAETFILPNMTEERFLGWRVKEVQDTNLGVKKVSTGEFKDIEEGSFILGEETDVDRLFKAGTTIKIKNDVELEAIYEEI